MIHMENQAFDISEVLEEDPDSIPDPGFETLGRIKARWMNDSLLRALYDQDHRIYVIQDLDARIRRILDKMPEVKINGI